MKWLNNLFPMIPMSNARATEVENYLPTVSVLMENVTVLSNVHNRHLDNTVKQFPLFFQEKKHYIIISTLFVFTCPPLDYFPLKLQRTACQWRLLMKHSAQWARLSSQYFAMIQNTCSVISMTQIQLQYMVHCFHKGKLIAMSSWWPC
jgi:hypothetical protein